LKQRGTPLPLLPPLVACVCALCTSASVRCLATATGALLLAFGLRPPPPDIDAALRQARVALHSSDVIYRLLDDLEPEFDAAVAAASGGGGAAGRRLASGGREQLIGEAAVLQVFPLLRGRREVGRVAGCRVGSGALEARSGLRYRVLREGEVLWEGPCSSLRVARDDVSSVPAGSECGVVLDGGAFGGFAPGDVLQCVQPAWPGGSA
jgi:translation initiation factor IF-2